MISPLTVCLLASDSVAHTLRAHVLSGARRLVLARRAVSIADREAVEGSFASLVSARDVADDLVLMEHLADCRKKSGEFLGEVGVGLRCIGEHHQLFANQVVERTLRPE